jgi:hypothetical protein
MRDSTELLKCSFSRARKALMEVAESAKLGEPWQSSNYAFYEFGDTD